MGAPIVYLNTTKRPTDFIDEVLYEYRRYKTWGEAGIPRMDEWCDVIDSVLQKMDEVSVGKRRIVEEFYGMRRPKNRSLRKQATAIGMLVGYSESMVYKILTEACINVYVNAIMRGLIGVVEQNEEDAACTRWKTRS